MSLGCSLLFTFLIEFEKNQYKFFFICFIEFACGAIWSWTFVCREFLNYRFYFTSSDRSFQIIYFFLIQFGRLYVSRNLSISSRLSKVFSI